ncbi:MAG TPA: hypothetical protein VIJ22_18720, partial [Polyangiaceae bacterium]
MKGPSDSRFAFLRDPDLYDLVRRLALKRVRNEALADDIRNGAYLVAMHLVIEGKGPKPGMERGWMCCVARNHTHEVLRALKEGEKPLETGDEPDIPVEDQVTLLAHQVEVERRFTVVEEVASKHPEHVEEALVDDARANAKKPGAHTGRARDAAARKRTERSRAFLAAAVSSALAVVIAVLWMRGPGAPKPAQPTAGSYATLADAAHQLASESCAARQWVACLDDLERLKRLDATQMGPREKEAWNAAVAGIRQEALAACAKGDFMTCLEGLDTAKRYDPAGDG